MCRKIKNKPPNTIDEIPTNNTINYSSILVYRIFLTGQFSNTLDKKNNNMKIAHKTNNNPN